jgi:26S proteasome regulatory subunit N12
MIIFLEVSVWYLTTILLCAGDILETGAQWSIAMKDIPSFERYMAQLKCYYLDYR